MKTAETDQLKLLITRALREIGKKILETALERRFQVIAFDLPTPRNRKPASRYEDPLVDLIWDDLRNFEEVQPSVEEQLAVIHLGGVVTPFGEKNPELSYRVSEEGTGNILRTREQISSAPALVSPSSMSVMDANGKREPPLKVNGPLIASSPYTKQKITCEQMIRNTDFPWVIMSLDAVINTETAISGSSLKGILSEAFSMNLDNRIEGVWNIDAAEALLQTAVLRYSGHEKLPGQTFFTGGGRKRRWQLTVREISRGVFTAVGFGMLKDKYCSKSPYDADRLDTIESERLFSYQNHTFQEFPAAMKKKLEGVKRPFILLPAPIIRNRTEPQSQYSVEGNRS